MLSGRYKQTVAPRVGGDHDARINTLKIGLRLPWGRNGFEIAITFPVEGDSAVVELTYDDIEWAYLELRDIDLAAEGEARVARSRVVVDLWPMVGTKPHARLWRRVLRRRDAETPSPDPPPEHFECAFEEVEARLEQTRAWWSFNPADAVPHLERAREVLLENERGRVPLEDEHGLTLVGTAWSKMSPENQAAMDPESDEDSEEGAEHSRDD